MTVRLQQELARELGERNAKVVERARRVAGDMSTVQLNWTPAPDRWSSGRILEHLCVACARYLERMRSWGSARGPQVPAEGVDWRPSLGGRVLVAALVSKYKLPAPAAFQPTANPRPGVLEIFLGHHEEIRDLLESTDRLDWSRIMVPSPVVALFRMNLGDCFLTLVQHAERHLSQIEDLRRLPRFPRASEGAAPVPPEDRGTGHRDGD